jgi:hypothetical protein
METALKTASKKNLNSVAIENPKSGLQVRYEWHNGAHLDFTISRKGATNSNDLLDGPFGVLGDLGRLLHKYHCVQSMPQKSDDGSVRIKFVNRDELGYIKGGWLEVLVSTWVQEAQPDDWTSGLKLAGMDNELDVVAVVGNQILLIEAKTMALAASKPGSDTQQTAGADALYKFDSITGDLARLFSNKILASVRDLAKPDALRAQRMRIKVFAPDPDRTGLVRPLLALKEEINVWVQKCRLEAEAGFKRSVFPAKPSKSGKPKSKGRSNSRKSYQGRKDLAAEGTAVAANDPKPENRARKPHATPLASALNPEAQAKLEALRDSLKKNQKRKP